MALWDDPVTSPSRLDGSQAAYATTLSSLDGMPSLKSAREATLRFSRLISANASRNVLGIPMKRVEHAAAPVVRISWALLGAIALFIGAHAIAPSPLLRLAVTATYFAIAFYGSSFATERAYSYLDQRGFQGPHAHAAVGLFLAFLIATGLALVAAGARFALDE